MNSLSHEKFLNDQGLVASWPSKQANKKLVIAYLADKFDIDKTYHELEINKILKQWHTFSDWPLLRRSLIDYGYLTRNRDGTEYRRVT